MRAVRSKIILFAGALALVCVAYVLGTQAAGWLGEWNLARNADEYRARAVEQTAAVLRKMGTIKVGDTLSNFAFEDIDGELHLLKQIVTDRTLITYIQPDCDACLVELERLRSAVESPADYERVLIISSANPLHLQRLREDYGLGCRMLFDEERLFGTALKIQTFPFNLVVDRSRVILEIHAGALLPDDYERLFSAVRPLPGGPAGNGRSTGLLPYYLFSAVRWVPGEPGDCKHLLSAANGRSTGLLPYPLRSGPPPSHPEPVEGWLADGGKSGFDPSTGSGRRKLSLTYGLLVLRNMVAPPVVATSTNHWVSLVGRVRTFAPANGETRHRRCRGVEASLLRANEG